MLLSNSVYAGVARFNKSSARTRTRKAESEQVTASAPSIIAPPIFERVQAKLKAHNPRVTPPRVASGPILLTGLAFCATCSGAMTLRTGTSKSGKVHKYYTCSTCARQGTTVCKGRSIRMDRLDELVTSHLLDRLLVPERLRALLNSVAAKRAEKVAAADDRVAALQARADDADERLRRLYKLVEDGGAEMDDLLKDRIKALKADREAALAAPTRARGARRAPILIAPANIATFGRLMRERLTTGGIQFRKAYIGAIVDRIEVDDHRIRICGRKDVLEQAISAGDRTPGRCSQFCTQMAHPA